MGSTDGETDRGISGNRWSRKVWSTFIKKEKNVTNEL